MIFYLSMPKIGIRLQSYHALLSFQKRYKLNAKFKNRSQRDSRIRDAIQSKSNVGRNLRMKFHDF